MFVAALASVTLSPGVRPRLKSWLIHKAEDLHLRARPKYPPLDRADYDRRMQRLFHLVPPAVSASSATVPAASSATVRAVPWPNVYPNDGALLPFHRVIAFYGNFRSKQMGILGEFPEEVVLGRLRAEVAKWSQADPQTPALPALHYVAVTAQGAAGQDHKYRLRMPESDIRRVIAMARKANAVVFLDVQVARSTVQTEVPRLDAYLKMPDVHLGLDPEFSMKGKANPGQAIGTMDAAEINWAIAHLSRMVEENGLPPKILVIHRFVYDMVTNIRQIHPTPQVQVVIDADGWGAPSRKQKTYRLCVAKDPVQFTGFKIFFKNDLREPGSHIMQPDEVLTLTPQPIYIQYQ